MFRFLKNTNRRQNERQTMAKFWLKWFAKKIIKWKKKNWNQTAFLPCVRLWFAINFFSSCFYILLCLLAITPLWSIATETTEMGHFDLESSVEISEQKVQHSYLLQRKKNGFKAMLIAERTLIMLWRKPRASERNKHVKYI